MLRQAHFIILRNFFIIYANFPCGPFFKKKKIQAGDVLAFNYTFRYKISFALNIIVHILSYVTGYV